MTKITVKTSITAPADEVWRLVGGWNALPEWHPAVKSSKIEEGGHRRHLKLADGSEITEQLEAFDKKAQTYTYSVVSSGLPYSYTATLSVKRDGDQAEIKWESTFKPFAAPTDEVVKELEEFYKSGFDNLRKLLGIK